MTILGKGRRLRRGPRTTNRASGCGQHRPQQPQTRQENVDWASTHFSSTLCLYSALFPRSSAANQFACHPRVSAAESRGPDPRRQPWTMPASDQPMTSVRLATYIGGGALLVAWFAAASSPVREPPPPRDPRTRCRPRFVVACLRACRRRRRSCASGWRRRPRRTSIRRNPFSFAPRSCRARPDAGALVQGRRAGGAPAPVVAGCPALSLDGDRGGHDAGGPASHRGDRRRRRRALYGHAGPVGRATGIR